MPLSIRLLGDRDAALKMLKAGKNLLADVKEAMSFQGLKCLSKNILGPNFAMSASSVHGIDIITLYAPYGVAKPEEELPSRLRYFILAAHNIPSSIYNDQTASWAYVFSMDMGRIKGFTDAITEEDTPVEFNIEDCVECIGWTLISRGDYTKRISHPAIAVHPDKAIDSSRYLATNISLSLGARYGKTSGSSPYEAMISYPGRISTYIVNNNVMSYRHYLNRDYWDQNTTSWSYRIDGGAPKIINEAPVFAAGWQYDTQLTGATSNTVSGGIWFGRKETQHSPQIIDLFWGSKQLTTGNFINDTKWDLAASETHEAYMLMFRVTFDGTIESSSGENAPSSIPGVGSITKKVHSVIRAPYSVYDWSYSCYGQEYSLPANSCETHRTGTACNYVYPSGEHVTYEAPPGELGICRCQSYWEQGFPPPPENPWDHYTLVAPDLPIYKADQIHEYQGLLADYFSTFWPSLNFSTSATNIYLTDPGTEGLSTVKLIYKFPNTSEVTKDLNSKGIGGDFQYVKYTGTTHSIDLHHRTWWIYGIDTTYWAVHSDEGIVGSQGVDAAIKLTVDVYDGAWGNYIYRYEPYYDPIHKMLCAVWTNLVFGNPRAVSDPGPDDVVDNIILLCEEIAIVGGGYFPAEYRISYLNLRSKILAVLASEDGYIPPGSHLHVAMVNMTGTSMMKGSNPPLDTSV